MPGGSNIDNGNILAYTNLSANTLNQDLVPQQDVSGFSWLTLKLGNSAYSAVIRFYGTDTPDDSSSWVQISLYRLADKLYASTYVDSTYNAAFGGPIIYRYFKATITSYTSGTIIATLELRASGLPGFQMLGTTSYADPDSYNALAVASPNYDGLILLTSAAITTNSNSADMGNTRWRGAKIFITTGSFGAGASAITVKIQGKDPTSGNYYDILTSASLSASGFTVLTVYPTGIASVANVTAVDVLPKSWRITYQASAWGTGGSTLGISAAMCI